MQALSLDLRKRIVWALLAGSSRRQIAQRFDVSESSVYRVQRQWKSQGDLTARKHPGRTPHLKDEDLPALEALVQSLIDQQKDPTGATLVVAWEETTGQSISLATMHRALHRLKFSYKKRAALPKNGTRKNARHSEKR